ncbi:MAG: DUF1080 domain-containing protein [Bacteroidetes Order II. Incertae sedis bacterium]|nr:DUF1080 domain-containing protein [Bacteroidetes Order II. bacterium]
MRLNFTLFFCIISIFGCKKADIPVPMLTPDEAIRDFRVAEGFQVELVAAEPQISSPVAINFDENGRMWVVEMRGYMPNIHGTNEDKAVGRISILQDRDGDGFFESGKTFMEGLVQPRALSFVKGGVLLAEPPNLWFVPIQNDKPGQKVLIDSTYADTGNVEHQPNGLLRAMDNWIYSAKGEVRYRQNGNGWLREEAIFRGQWGISQDDYGRLFYNNNSTTLLGDAYLPAVFPVNPHHAPKSNTIYNLQLVANTVFPRRQTRGVNRGYEKDVLDAAGKLRNVTSACGPVIYRGDQFPAAYRGHAFVMEPVGYLIKHIRLREENDQPRGAFDAGKEFLTATDERFRPVNAHTAPDGSLFVVDMHSGIIQHATYMTPYLRNHIQHYRLDQPTGMGRIFRIRHKNKPLAKAPQLRMATVKHLVATLSHPNGWWRDTAQRLLIEREDPTAIPLLIESSLIGAPLTKLHALWTLEGLKAHSVEHLDRIWQTAPEGFIREAILHQMARWAGGEQHETALSWLKNHPPSKSVKVREKASWVAAIAAHARDNVTVLKEVYPTLAEADTFPVLIDALITNIAGLETPVLRLLGQHVPTSVKNALHEAIEKSRQSSDAALQHLSKPERGLFAAGKGNYAKYCATCHASSGEGIKNLAPPLAGSEWVSGDPRLLGRIVLDGLTGPITVQGETYTFNAPMPGFRDNIEVNNEALAGILTFIRNSWGHKAGVVWAKDMILLRAETQRRNKPYAEKELRAISPNPRHIGVIQPLRTYHTSSPAQVRHKMTIDRPRWRKLFDGKTLKGWHILGGKATFRVENGEIIGETALNTPNTFLATHERYGDFVLELELKVDTLLNSGIQIRSNTFPDYLNGMVHGYQVEVDPSIRAWSGGIYDENRRLWMYDLKNKPKAQQAFRNNQWNHYRIAVVGSRIRTWVNGVPIADLADGLTLSGFIGLQVHGIGNDVTKKGLKVRWRNIRLLDYQTTTWFANSDPQDHPISAVNDDLPVTFWQSSAPDSWIEADFKRPRLVSSVQIAFHMAAARRYAFRILASEEGRHWRILKEGQSSPQTGLQTFSFPSTTTRYIRIIGLGHAEGRENAYTTIRIP